MTKRVNHIRKENVKMENLEYFRRTKLKLNGNSDILRYYLLVSVSHIPQLKPQWWLGSLYCQQFSLIH